MARIRLKAFPATYTPVPFQELAYVAEKKQDLKNKAFDLESNLEAEFGKIGALPVDAQERDRIIQDYRSKLASVYDQNKGNPNSLLNGFKQVQRDFTKEVNYGKLGGIHKRHQGYLESAKEKSDYVTSYVKTGKGLTDEEAQQTLNHELSVLNANPIEQTPYGTWQTYNTKSVVPHMELQDVALEIGKNIKPEQIEAYSGLKDAGMGYLYDEKTGKKELAAPYVSQIVRNTMMTMPEVNSFLDFKHTVSGNKNAWATEATQNPYGLLSKDGSQSVEPNEWFAQQYYNDVQNAANNAGNLLQQIEITKDRSHMQNWLMKEAMDKQVSTNAVPLNIPYSQTNNSVSTTIDNLKTTVIPGTTQTQVYGGSYGPGMGMFDTKVTRPDYPTVYNTLSPLDKVRVDFIKEKLKLPNDVTTWKEEEWKKAIDGLEPYTTKKVSSVQKSFTDSKFRKQQGDFYNANMEQFVFYDPNNTIGINDNNMYTGSELRQAGYKIDELIGTLSNSNIVPTKIAGQAYTFARPDVITTTKADGSTGSQLYVGINKAQIDNTYRINALENALSISKNTGIPQPLFNNPEIVVVPKGDFNYDIKLSSGETVSIKADSPESFRATVINLYNSSPVLQQIVEEQIFGKEQ